MGKRLERAREAASVGRNAMRLRTEPWEPSPMRVYRFLVAGAILGLAFSARPARAQDSTLHKAGAAVHHTLKKTGNAVKKDAKKVGSATHQTLRTAGNKTKTAAGDVTGVHKVGGTVGSAAQSVSRTGKTVGRSAKHSLKSSKATVHHDLQKTGDSTKAAIKKPQ
jgi:hypothetical protein